MPRRLALVLAVLCGLLVMAGFAARPAAPPANDRIVVLITIDGFPAYALDDPRLPVPTLRALAAGGATARRLHIVNPAITWPNHTAMVTGVTPARHGVLFNGVLLAKGPGQPLMVDGFRDRSEMVRVKTLYDAAHEAGLTTAQVDWVAIQNAPTITWQVGEFPSATGTIEREMVAAGQITEDDIKVFSHTNGPWRDQVWTKAAIQILRQHKPNLMLFHLLNLDGVHHRYGPRNVASLSAMAFADDRVRDFVKAIHDAGLKDRTTLVVASDHGFKTVHHDIHPNVALRQAGLLRDEGGKLICDAWVVPEGGVAMVYVTNAARRDALLPELKRVLGSIRGVERVVEPGEYVALGLPSPEQNAQMAPLLLVAGNGYAFDAATTGEVVKDLPAGAQTGTHGYLASDPDMDAILIASGYGIRAGARLDSARTIDIAPTLATLLGVKLENVEGRPLTELLKP